MLVGRERERVAGEHGEGGMSGRAVVLRGDAAHLPLPDGSVDLIACSPPYFGQRDYRDGGKSLAGQIGSEETPREYLAALWACTQDWVRVLKPGGSLFVNLGDKFSQRVATRRSSHQDGLFPGRPELRKDWKRDRVAGLARMPYENVINDEGRSVPEKSMMGLPWRYAFGCMDDLGLILRRDIIWRKNGMPESVTDRCPTDHEYLFHFTRQARYYSACDEIREPLAAPGRKAGARAFGSRNANHERSATGEYAGQNPLGALPGSVWDIPTEPLIVPEYVAHLRCCGGRARPGCEDGLRHDAAWPTALVRRIILGWSPPGICRECGEGRKPVAPSVRTFDGQPRDDLPAWAEPSGPRRTPNGSGHWRFGTDRRIAGYACACLHPDAPTRPAVVVDPFQGSGTTLLVADVLGRIGIGLDLSMDYARLAVWRTSDPRERARALGVPKPPPVIDGQGSLFDSLESA